MSLIVARHADGEINIVSETKLTYPDHDVKRQQTNPEEGTIKTVIVNDSVSISFAGELAYASKAIKQISPQTSIESIIEILKQAHQESEFKTDFILCYLDPTPTIYKIKNKEYGQVVSCWIGDLAAFNLFQTFFMGGKNNKDDKKGKKKNYTRKDLRSYIQFDELNLGVSGPSSQLATRMCNAMDKVIEEGIVNSVGGFRVHVKMKESSLYNFYMHSYRNSFTIEVNDPTQIPIGHGNAQEGAYSIYFLGASPDHQHIGIHLRQGNIGFIYSRYNGDIFKPELKKMDEVDFLDYAEEKFNIKGPFATVDRVSKFANDGLVAFKANEFEKALHLFEKEISSAKEKQKAKLLFYKGVTLLNLRNLQEAKKSFDAACDLNPELRHRINAVFAQHPGDWQ